MAAAGTGAAAAVAADMEQSRKRAPPGGEEAQIKKAKEEVEDAPVGAPGRAAAKHENGAAAHGSESRLEADEDEGEDENGIEFSPTGACKMQDGTYTVIAVGTGTGGAGEPEKRVAKREDIRDSDLGILVNIAGFELICEFDRYQKHHELVPLFRPKGACSWYPAGGLVEVEFLRWNEGTSCFECVTGKKSNNQLWKRACVACVQAVLSGDTDSCKTAAVGKGRFPTHCSGCRPPTMKIEDPKHCVVCRRADPIYGWPNSSKMSHCPGCKKKGMARLDFKRCEKAGCKSRATHGLDGESTHCSEHKTAGMALGFKPCMRCKKENAVTGRQDRITHCYACMDEVIAGIKASKKRGKKKAVPMPVKKSSRRLAARKAASRGGSESGTSGGDSSSSDSDSSSASSLTCSSSVTSISDAEGQARAPKKSAGSRASSSSSSGSGSGSEDDDESASD